MSPYNKSKTNKRLFNDLMNMNDLEDSKVRNGKSKNVDLSFSYLQNPKQTPLKTLSSIYMRPRLTKSSSSTTSTSTSSSSYAISLQKRHDFSFKRRKVMKALFIKEAVVSQNTIHPYNNNYYYNNNTTISTDDAKDEDISSKCKNRDTHNNNNNNINNNNNNTTMRDFNLPSSTCLSVSSRQQSEPRFNHDQIDTRNMEYEDHGLS